MGFGHERLDVYRARILSRSASRESVRERSSTSGRTRSAAPSWRGGLPDRSQQTRMTNPLVAGDQRRVEPNRGAGNQPEPFSTRSW